ncbi:MAG TPA: L,D-transpeptidase family protein [Firmicutes bacterium]|nr:L,D-transpeptidase family protein [Bacillota bacterium]
MKPTRPVVFKRGDRSPFIADAQEMLAKLGYDPGRVQGLFAAKTEEAVREFQKKQGLKETGVLDCETIKLLYDLADPGNYPGRLLEGDEGEPQGEKDEEDESPPAAGPDAGSRFTRAGATGSATAEKGTTADRRTIVISIGERALGLYEGHRLIRKYPVAIGKPDTPTPVGKFRVLEKVLNPGGALGTRWLGFTYEMHGIHGTNRPELIGQEVSHGCVRMYNENVEELFDMVELGTPVIVITGPVESWPGIDGAAGSAPGTGQGTPPVPGWSGGPGGSSKAGTHETGGGTLQQAGPQAPKDPQDNQGMLGPEHIYIVQPGDTLWNISRRFGASLDAIIRLNDIRNPDLIYPGQRLRIPRGG